MTRAMRLIVRAFGTLARWLLVLAACVACAALAAGLYLSTEAGEARLIAAVVTKLNEMLPGQIAVRRLVRFGLSSVELEGVRLDAPAGNEVVAIERLSAGFDIGPLLRGRIELAALALTGVRLDLRFPDHPRVGLISALVAPDSADVEPATEGGLPDLRVEHLELRHWHVLLPDGSSLLPTEVSLAAVDASARVGEQLPLEVEVQQLEGSLRREDADLGSFRLRGHGSVARGSRFELDAELCGVALDGEIELDSVPLPFSDWREIRSTLRVALRDLTAARLSSLVRDPALGGFFLGALSTELLFQGTANEFVARGGLSTAAGDLSIAATARQLSAFDLTLATAGDLKLARLREGLPAWRLEAQLALSSKLVSGRPLLELHTSSASIDGEPLPDIQFRGELEPAALRNASLSFNGPGLKGTASGDLAFDGELHVLARADIDLARILRLAGALGAPNPFGDPRVGGRVDLELDLTRRQSGAITAAGSLRAPSVQLAGGQIERLAAKFSLAEGKPLPVVRIEGEWAAAHHPSLELEPGWLRLEGGPNRYAFALQSGAPRVGSVSAQGWLSRHGAESRFALAASGIHQAAPWRLNIEPSVVTDRQEVSVPGALLVFADQRAMLSGHYSEASTDLALEFTKVDLSRLLAPFQLGLELQGNSSGRLVARGPAKSLELELELTGSGLGLVGGPTLGAQATAKLRAESGAFELRADVREELQKSSQAKPRLELAVHIQSELGQGTSSLSDVWMNDHAVDVQFSRLNSSIIDELAQVESSVPFDIHGSLSVLRRNHVTSVRAKVDGAMEGPAFRTAKVGAGIEVEHEPGSEPRGELTFDIEETSVRSKLGGCSHDTLTTHGRVGLAGGQLDGELTAHSGGTRLLRVHTRGAFPTLPLLRGESPAWPTLDAEAEVKGLALSQLPFVCLQSRGVLSAEGRVRDLFGTASEASLDVTVQQFSLDGDETVELKAKLALDRERLTLLGSVGSGEHVSKLEGQVPRRDLRSSIDAPKQAPLGLALDLDRLPIAPFIPPDSPVSHASGSLSGKLTVAGTSGAPRLLGKLRLQDVAFTLTELAQPVNDVNGELSFSGDTVLVKGLSARDGDGQLGIDGRLKIVNGATFDGAFDLDARKFPLRQAGQVVATTSAKAHIETNWGPAARNLRVRLSNFDTWLESVRGREGLALEPHPDLVVNEPRRAAGASRGATEAPAPVVQADANGDAGPPQAPLRVSIDAGQEFWIRRADFAVKLSADLQIAVNEASKSDSGVSITGKLRFDRGYLELLGKVFEIERGGTLRFPGGTSATLDLAATYEDRRTDKVVRVHLSGSAESPHLDFQVDNETVTAGRAFQAIYGTEDSSEDEDDVEAEAKQFVSAVTAGMITSTIRRRFGAMAPILMLDPEDAEGTSQLRAGFELDALIPDFLDDVITGIYVEGILSSEKQEDQSGPRDVQSGVLVELYFPYNLVTSGQYGSNSSWSLDLGWQP